MTPPANLDKYIVPLAETVHASIPEGAERAVVECTMGPDELELSFSYEQAGKGSSPIALIEESDLWESLRKGFRDLHEASVATGSPWKNAKLHVGADGKFNIAFTYE